MASNRVKGITVEINGSTTGLDKALSGVNKNLKDTQSKLKDVDRLLKLDPKNTILLEQKQRLLKDSISQTKEKLQSLKSVQDQMESGLKDASVTQDQYDAWQREIAETEQALKDLEKAQKDLSTTSLSKMSEIGGGIKNVGDKMTSIGTGMTKYVTAPVVAVGAASIAAFNEVDNGMDTIAKKTGATGEELKAMEDMAEHMATSIPTDFATVGTAIGEVNTRFGLTGDSLEKLSTKFIKFSDLNDTDVNSSIDSVSSVLHAFNMNSSEASDVLDVMNKVGQQTGIPMDTLAQSISSNAASLQEMGLSALESVQLLGKVEMSGMDTSAAMMGLKTAMKNASKDGKTLNRAFLEWQDTISGAGSDTDKLNASLELFGSRAGAQFYNAAKNGQLSLDSLQSGMEGFRGSVESTFEQTLDPIDNWKTTMNELKLLGADIGGMLGEILGPALKDLREMLHGLVEKWRSLSPETQKAIGKFILFVAAAGPVLTVVGKLTSGFGGLLGKLTGGGSGGGLIGGVKSLVGGIKGIISNGGPAATALKALGAAGASVGAAVAGWTIGGKISDELYKAGVYGEDVAGVLDDWFKQDYGQRAVTLVKTIGEEVSYWADDVKQYWHEVFHPEDAPKWKREGYKSAEDYYKAVLERTGAWEEQTIDEYGNVVTVIHTKNSEMKKDAVETVNDLTDATKAAFGGMPSDVADALAETNSKLKSFSENDVKEFTDATKSSLAGIPSDVAEKMAQAKESLTQSAASAKESFAGVPEDVRQKMAEMNSNVDEAVDATKSSFAGIPSDVAEKMAAVSSSVDNTVDSTKSSMAGVPPDVAEKMAMVKNSVTETVESTKSSMAGVPPDVAEKMAKMKDSVTNTVESTKQTLAGVPESVRQIMERSKTPVEGFVDATKSSLAGIPSDVAEKMSQMSATTKSTLDDVSNKFHGLDLSLPKVKLPHFSIQGKFSLNPLSVPRLSIDWYKKAMDNGMILNSPTIFGAAGGKFLGAGEAGPEAVVGAESLRNMIMEAVASQTASLAGLVGDGGDITIPVYIGGNLLDEIVVTAQQRMSLRSGGR